jgi:hypothetical protein
VAFRSPAGSNSAAALSTRYARLARTRPYLRQCSISGSKVAARIQKQSRKTARDARISAAAAIPTPPELGKASHESRRRHTIMGNTGARIVKPPAHTTESSSASLQSSTPRAYLRERECQQRKERCAGDSRGVPRAPCRRHGVVAVSGGIKRQRPSTRQPAGLRVLTRWMVPRGLAQRHCPPAYRTSAARVTARNGG